MDEILAKKFKVTYEERQKYLSILEAQKYFLKDFHQTIKGSAEVTEKLKLVDENILKTDKIIESYNRSLLIYMKNYNLDDIKEENKIMLTAAIKFIIFEVLNQIQGLALMTLDNKCVDIPITGVIDIQYQVIDIFDTLVEKNIVKDALLSLMSSEIDSFREKIEKNVLYVSSILRNQCKSTPQENEISVRDGDELFADEDYNEDENTSVRVHSIIDKVTSENMIPSDVNRKLFDRTNGIEKGNQSSTDDDYF